MGLSAGTRLGPYEIVAPLGAGGMGEVYRACDTRLGRDVALKVVHPGLASDPERLSRFEKEARAAAQIDHPNILVVHDVGTHEGSPFIVSELLQGESLREKLGAPLPPKKAVDYAVEIARGLAAAHEKGIVHRDIKPENIFVTKDGHVKILDFGVAKLLPSFDASGVDTETPTENATQPGTALGTVAYMSPEQIRGQPVDARSDLFSLGVVLYEMLSGKRPFQRDTPAEIMTAILREEPPSLAGATPAIPPALQEIVSQSLEKHPAGRFSSAHDLALALQAAGSLKDEAPNVPVATIGPAVSARRRRVAPLALAALAVIALAFAIHSAWTHRAAGPGRREGRVMLAVLPVENLNRDPEQEYFSDGLTEELIAQLGGLKPARLGVIARTSAMRYKRTQKPIDQIGRELGVDYVLESSVRREGGRVRITVQLIGAHDQTHLWAESYERDLAGVLAIQSEVSERVARSLAIELLPSERARLDQARPVNPEAHELCLKGRHHWYLRTTKDLLTATEFFRAAIAADPAYALAWAGLGDTYALYPHYGVLDSHSSFLQARTAAEKALALDPALVEAETTLAFVVFYSDWDWVGTETRLKRILERRPDYAIARQWYAEYLSAMGRHDEALQEIRRARETDPLSPILRVMEGYVLLYARRYEQALESLRKVQPLEPDYPLVYQISAQTYKAMGRYPEALGAYAHADELEALGGSPNPQVAEVLALSGKRDEARKLLATVSASGRGDESRWRLSLVAARAALGEIDEAIVLLGKAYDDRAVGLVRAGVDPRFDLLRAEPRFQDLLRRMKLPARRSQ
jgi:eukaryotic-like serine/threonine-protein kinase